MLQPDDRSQHSAVDHLAGWLESGRRSDHVYVRTTNKTAYVGKSLAVDNRRGIKFRDPENAVTKSAKHWPAMYRISLPTACREDLDVTERLLIRSMHYVADDRQLRFLNGDNTWGKPGFPIPNGYDIWIEEDPANGKPRAFTKAEDINIDCRGPYRFCHAANRDAVLDALHLSLHEVRPYFPQGQLLGLVP